jgi:hypothetical protein
MTLAVKRVCDLKLVMRDDQITEYDRAHFLTYARILDAVRFDQAWQEAAIEILDLDVEGDEYGSYRIWRAHVDRAEWIVSDGLAFIVQTNPVSNHLIH